MTITPSTTSTPAPAAPPSRGDESSQVLVVGAGPVGLTLAADLLRRGITVRIIDAAPAASATSRATSQTPRTLEVLDDLGAAEELLATGVRIAETVAYSGDRLAFRLRFPSTDTTRFPYLLNNSQADTEAALTALLHRLGGAVERGRELVGFRQDRAEVAAQLRAAGDPRRPGAGRIEEVRAGWMVAADGARSRVRKTLAIPFRGQPIAETIVLGDVTMDWDRPGDKIYSWFSPDGSLLAFPFRQPGRWRLTTALIPEEVDRFGQGSLERITELYRKRTGDTTTAITGLDWFSAFVAQQRLADSYRVGRVLLAGDAAHVHTPAGGLGMNTGIQDAYNLGWKLALVAAGRAPEALLDTYQRERRPIAEALLSSTGGLQKLYSLRSPAAQAARDTAMRTLLDLGPLRRAFFRRAGQLDLNYHNSALSRTVARRTPAAWPAGARPGARAGDRAPDGPALTVHPGGEKQTWLHEHLRGPWPTLLLFSGRSAASTDPDRLVDLARRVRQSTGHVRVVAVAAPQQPPPAALDEHATVLLDPTGLLHHRYGAALPAAYLVRPDGHLGMVTRPASPDPILAYLPTLAGTAANPPR
jgi:2-polyprenyl-6-methoxyphenol hydroxylase-like FAD-dependent oxidoreductase